MAGVTLPTLSKFDVCTYFFLLENAETVSVAFRFLADLTQGVEKSLVEGTRAVSSSKPENSVSAPGDGLPTTIFFRPLNIPVGCNSIK